ncbi:MAG: extracellular solute-binding protein [Treponema sp.]|nr:extracellular solute-binding protein [Treponema sp.]
MKIIVIATMAAAALLSPLFALGKKKTKQTVITVLDYQDATAPNSYEDNKLIWDAFEKAHPDIKIEREVLFNEPYHQKMAAYAASGKMPDVFYMWPSGRSAAIHEKKLAKDLTPFMKQDNIYTDYNKACIDPSAQASGYIAELPMGLTVSHMLYVNTEILKECGLSIPKTYEELKAQVPVLKAKGYETILMANMDDWVMQSCLFSCVAGRFGGADWADKIKAGKAKFTDKPFLDAVRFIKTLYDDGVLSQKTLATSYGDVVGQFASKKGAYLIDGDWRVAAFLTDSSTGKALISKEDQKNSIELINFPAIPGEKIHGSNSSTLGVGYGMSSKLKKNSKEEKAAWELIKWLLGPYCQQRRLDTGASFPSLTSGVSYANLEPLSAKRAAFYSGQTISTPVFDSVFEGDVPSVLNADLQALGLRQKTPEQVCKDVQAAYDASK